MFSAGVGVRRRRPSAALFVAEASMTTPIRGRAHLLGDEVNTDIHCSSKYLPGRDSAFVAARAFEQIAPGFASRLRPGDLIVAGRHFGINSSREQAVEVMRMMGVAAVLAASFGRQFFRNAINGGLPVAECDVAGIEEGDEVELDLAAGRVRVPARGIERAVPPLPAAIRAVLAAGGLIPFVQRHPDWGIGANPDGGRARA
jgi:3-isopropylmalate dehydratase small subunit